MLFSIVRHGWLSFVRAHYFRRSLGTKLVIGFVVVSMLFYMYLAGRQLPEILQILHPGEDPLQVFLSFLIFLYAFDFMVRLMGQKVPRQHITAYLHLPVSKNKLAIFTLIRSWLSLYNVYLFTLLIPFFRLTMPAANTSAAYYNMLAGCFLLGIVNHMLVLLFKLQQQRKPPPPVMLALGILLFFFVGWFFADHITLVSLQLGKAIISGQPWIFLLLTGLVIALHIVSVKSLSESFYSVESNSMPATTGKQGFIEKLLGRTPLYGMYWVLEWQLIMRNKRARQSFYQTLLMPLVMIYLLYTSSDNITGMAPFLLLILGSYGIIHLQYVYSWESRFFDFIATSSIDMQAFIRSKYHFYVLIASLQFLLLTPAILLFVPGIFPILLGLFLYACGAVFCFLLYTGLSNSTRIDPNRSAFFNYEGTSGKLFISILVIFLSTIPLFIGGAILPMKSEYGFSLLAGLTGLIFMATSNRWITHIAKKYAQNKHSYLSKFREK